MGDLLIKEGALVLMTNGFVALVDKMNKKRGTATLIQMENRVRHTIKLIDLHKYIVKGV